MKSEIKTTEITIHKDTGKNGEKATGKTTDKLQMKQR
jgi:hypothetical protein